MQVQFAQMIRRPYRIMVIDRASDSAKLDKDP